MDREILFRGRQLNGSEWFIGDLSRVVHDDGTCYVFPADGYNSPDWYEVDKETIGQYTGVNDRGGNRIFEGDYCAVIRTGALAYGFITFYQGCFLFEEKGTGNLLRLCDLAINGYKIEILGNIYDNQSC